MDYVSTLQINFALIAPELALLIGAFLIMLTVRLRHANQFAAVVGFLALSTALVLSMLQWGTQGTGFGGMVTSDSFGILFRILFAFGSLLALAMGYRFLQAKGLERPEYYVFLLISTFGMMVMANTTDLVVMFLGLEIMSVPLYIMAALNKRSLESNEAGLKYILMGSFASAFLLMGIAFMYGAAESTDLKLLVANFDYISQTRALYLWVSAALLLVGFGFKVAAVPFHSWAPDVYQGAPTPVTGFFSVGPKAAGFAVLLRTFGFAFQDINDLTWVFWVMAVLTMTVGNLLALRQDNIKRMLAYSSIAHAGYLLMALVVGTDKAVSAAIYYLFAYTLFTLGSFAILVILETRSGMKSEFKELTGLSKTHPWLALMLALFMFAVSGFPPTAGFFGKFYLFSSAVEAGFVMLAVIGVLNSLVSVYYYFRVIKTSYFDQAEGSFVPAVVSPLSVLVILVALVGTLSIGLFPEQLMNLTRAAVFAVL